MKPLDNITVISIEQAVAAPFCTRQLADLGARVIKIERPGVGDFARGYDDRVNGQASYFVWINRSKESMALDIKQPRARQILEKLIAKADVLVQNLAPGSLARLELSTAELRHRFPRLVICDISGYGLGGPYRDRKAYDLLVQAEAGLLSVTGTPGEMVRSGISVADIAAGMYAFTNILTALLQRSRTGKGCHIDVSLLESLTEWMGSPLYYCYQDAPQAGRSGASHPSIYPYGPFACGDGKIILMGIQNEREWSVFCKEVLGLPELKDDERFISNTRRSDNREQLKQIIEKKFSAFNSEEIINRLDNTGIANAAVNDIADVWHHQQLAARGRWVKVDTPNGVIDALLPPGINDSFSPRMDPVPAIGEHTDAILSELGFTLEEITALHEDNTV